jgi:hypothetical protein
MTTLSRRAPKGEEIKLRVSAAEKAMFRKAAARGAARFERVADPELVSRRPELKNRYLSEWARQELLSAARRVAEDDPGSDGDHQRPPVESEPADGSGPSTMDREAAWNALVELTKAGWRSEAAYGDRDELHDR